MLGELPLRQRLGARNVSSATRPSLYPSLRCLFSLGQEPPPRPQEDSDGRSLYEVSTNLRLT